MKKKSLIIDLTSLLDIILIILFLVLVQSSNFTNSKIDTLKKENINLEKVNIKLRENQMPTKDYEKKWQKIYNDKFQKIDLLYPKNKENSLVLRYSDGKIERKAETDNFEDWLKKKIKEINKENIIITFSYYNDSIYIRDYNETRDLILSIVKYSNKNVVYEEVLLGGE